MAYASTTHVEALNKGRPPFSATPVAGQVSQVEVVRWLEETAGVIDGLLRADGYAVPVGAAAATSALQTLESFNALGAAYYVERGSKQSDRLKEAREAWEWAQKMLADGLVSLDLPTDSELEMPRGGFSSAATPYFTRDLEL